MAKGIIRKSTSPWASPIVLVRKKKGSIRPCIDYRRVNELVKPDGFPMPRIQDCLDAVSGAALFSTLDLTSGYYQIPLKKEDIPKSAFVCKYGQFELTRMPFGLNNAGSTFQRTMELALQGLQWETCLLYIDDIIVFGNNFEQHIGRLEQVFARLKDARLKLKPNKCQLLQSEVTFLGHIVTGEGVKPNPVNIAKVVGWPRPQHSKQVKQFVAMGSYYRRFVQDFAKRAKPLLELTKKGKTFIWDKHCEQSFKDIKEALIGSEVMGYPQNEGGEFILDVDASDVGIGGVLAQIQNGRERVIAYGSRTLNKAESNYCITEKELLAVRYFIEYFRQYLLGRRFRVRSDHQALVWLFRLKEPRGKIARWLEILAQYDFFIEYRPGKKQGHCDALSRCENPYDCDCPYVDTCEPLRCGPCRKCQKRAIEMCAAPPKHQEVETKLTQEDKRVQSDFQAARSVASTAKTVEEPSTSMNSNASSRSWMKPCNDMRKAQLSDPDIAPILLAKEKGLRPKNSEVAGLSPAARHYWILWDALKLVGGVLVKQYVKEDKTGTFTQTIIPESLKREVLFHYHNTVMAGHLGTKKTKQKLAQTCYWYNHKEDINLYVKQCDVCAADKGPSKKSRAPMGSLKTGAPWDVVAMDYLGPLPITPRGNRYILVLTDHFSRYVEVIPVPDQTAETCAAKLLNELIARWGCPLSFQSDQGRTFESRIFKELCRMLEVRKSRTSSRHPQCNGQTERFNRTLIKMIKAYQKGEQDNWDLHLGCIAGAYRSSQNETTRYTPNLLALGREIRQTTELIFGSATTDQQTITSYGEYVDSLRARMQKAHEIARRHIGEAAKRSKIIYDSKLSVNTFKAGDVVWCLAESRKVGVTQKLEHSYEGPYLIKTKYSDLTYVLMTDGKNKEKTVHHNKLKPYEGVNTPRWIIRAKRSLPLPTQSSISSVF